MLVEVCAVGLLSAGATLVSARDGVTGSATRARPQPQSRRSQLPRRRALLVPLRVGNNWRRRKQRSSTCNCYRCCLSHQALEIHCNPYDLYGFFTECTEQTRFEQRFLYFVDRKLESLTISITWPLNKSHALIHRTLLRSMWEPRMPTVALNLYTTRVLAYDL